MFTIRDRIDEAVRLLADVSDTPRADAEFLISHVLGIPRSQLRRAFDDVIDVPEFRIFIERRMACEPVPYIIGEWEFFSVPIKTRAPVLVPRPETEHLVEVILEKLHGGDAPSRVLDLCTGSGCVAIALSMHLPRAKIIATDLSDEALALAGENIRWHGLRDRIALRKGDLFDALESADGPFDAVCANPPYVEDGEFPGLAPAIRLYEDPRALVAGPDGLSVIRRIVSRAGDHLAPRGLLALEIGERQYDSVAALLSRANFGEIRAKDDLAGIKRIACAVKA